MHALLETIASLAAKLEPQRPLVDRGWFGFSRPSCHLGDTSSNWRFLSVSQVKEAMQRIHDRGNIGKLILDVEKTPTPLVSQKQRHPFTSTPEGLSGAGTGGMEGSTGSPLLGWGWWGETRGNETNVQVRD